MTGDLTPPMSKVFESLLLPLYMRAIESQRMNPILKDERAVNLAHQLKLDDSMFPQARVSQEVQVSILLRNQQFDQIAIDYLSHHPDAVIVHIGCGLDTRFERVDNGLVEWYDLDLPEVINLRRELIGSEADRYHLLACSVLYPSWMDILSEYKSHPVLFLAEGVFMFFEEGHVRELVRSLKVGFPGSELAFDAFSPFYVWGNNRRVTRTNIGAIAHWGLKEAKDIESWADGIQLISAWYPFLVEVPRLAHIRWVRFIPWLAKTTGVFHYRLG